jgi:hypothetical protein
MALPRARRRVLAGIAAALLLVPGSSIGVPATAVAAECEGDECQVPPAAPDDPVPPTSAVQGPPNPPVRFPKAHKQGHHKKHHRHAGRGAR